MPRLKKGVWLHNLQQFAGPSQIRNFVRRYSDAGFDLLVPCVKNPDGLLDYHSCVGNVRPVYRSWDPLEILAEEACRRKIKVHAWFCNMHEGPKSKLLELYPKVAALNIKGKRVGTNRFFFVCAARPEVRRYEAALMKEVIDNYPVAGVHFDYIRVGDGVCYCPHCRRQLKRLEGIVPEKMRWWGRVPDRFFKWRCDNVTALVRDVSAHARRKRKEVSAAVYAGVPDSIMVQGQDFAAWSREGLLDLVAPMNYWNSSWLTEKYIRNHLAQNADGKAELWEGLGLFCMDSRRQFREQLDAVRRHRVPGVMIFEHNSLRPADLRLLARY